MPYQTLHIDEGDDGQDDDMQQIQAQFDRNTRLFRIATGAAILTAIVAATAISFI